MVENLLRYAAAGSWGCTEYECGHSCQLHRRHELPSQPGEQETDDICQEVPDIAWLPRRSQRPARQRRAAPKQEALQTT